ncbi:MAG: Uncharacterised protein [Cryomorphaceae bacterium]|nr:MAG: Uncharacterised protein [Cryomorphaceae bacterium]
MATLALMSQKVSNAKIAATGFEYKHDQLDDALTDLLSK